MIQNEFSHVDARTGAARWDRAPVSPIPVSEEGDSAEGWAKTRATLESMIGKYPGASFGAALLAGIAIGWWIKRR